jgi:hypothetical protein
VTGAYIESFVQALDVKDLDLPVSVLVGQLLEQCGDRNYLLRFYSRERLFCNEARACWVPPDLAAIG